MSSKDPAVYLQHVLDNIAHARRFTAAMSRDDFLEDVKTQYAVTRALEVISEASRRLPPQLKERHPEIDWAAIAAAGNVYRHNYPEVAAETLWDTVNESLEPLQDVLRTELEHLRAPR